MGRGGDYNAEKHLNLAKLLAQGVPKAKAARDAGFARSHVYLLLSKPEFQAKIEAARQELASKAPKKAKKRPKQADDDEPEPSLDETLRELRSILVDPTQHARDRVSAAKELMRALSGPKTEAPGAPAPAKQPRVLPKLTPEEAAAKWA